MGTFHHKFRFMPLVLVAKASDRRLSVLQSSSEVSLCFPKKILPVVLGIDFSIPAVKPELGIVLLIPKRDVRCDGVACFGIKEEIIHCP
jgi:hypothetical protein